jgi:hypothetical protein
MPARGSVAGQSQRVFGGPTVNPGRWAGSPPRSMTSAKCSAVALGFFHRERIRLKGSTRFQCNK